MHGLIRMTIDNDDEIAKLFEQNEVKFQDRERSLTKLMNGVRCHRGRVFVLIAFFFFFLPVFVSPEHHHLCSCHLALLHARFLLPCKLVDLTNSTYAVQKKKKKKKPYV